MGELNQEINKDLLIEQYKIFVQSKEKYTDRNFTTNKFFLCLTIVLLALLSLLHDEKFFYFLSIRTILAIIGMSVCILWWSNIDTYCLLQKVKLKGVIEEMEKYLPFECHLMEKNAFDEFRKKNNSFIFSDMQKILATLLFIFFMAIFLVSVFSFYMPEISNTFHLKMN